ncbi:MAG: cupin domain-containing protein [Alphaproteobacteria bacterium]|nr:cupin domain-containing protein [Alphaproteobacteria bacterium]
MTLPHRITPGLRRTLAAAGAVLALGAGAAAAGECPADKLGVDVTKPGTSMPKDVSDKVLAAIDLSKEPAMVQDRQFRIRRLEIKPGGIVPWHSHGNRPALIYIVSGEITEYASNCAVPIVHKAGDVARETSVTSHWWKNHGRKTVVLLSADLLQDKSDKSM